MILYLPLFFVITLGLVFGSFIFAMSIRLPAKESVWTRSHCFHCRTPIHPVGLIPVLGYLWCRRKCPDCKTKIPMIYPAAEVFNAALAVLIYQKTGWSIEFFHIFLIFQALLLISLIDFKTCLIFEHPIVFLLVFQSGWLFFYGSQKQVIDSLIGLAAGAGIFHWVSYLYQVIRNRIGLGEGDATLLGVIGFCFGWSILLNVIFWSALLGSLGAGTFLICNKKELGQKVAFGPWIALATFLIWIYPEFFKAFPFSI